jgi:hypothetical protein
MMTRKQAEAIAALVHLLREDWDARGVLAALVALKDHDAPAFVAIAAVTAAMDRTNRTPAVIPLAGKHWTTARPEDHVPTVGPGKERRCPDHEFELARNCRWCRADSLGGVPNPFVREEPIEPDQTERRPMPRIPRREEKSA